MSNSLIAMPQGAEWLVILVIVVLVFGASKLPDLARGSGQALRIFKAETKGLRDDDEKDDKAAPAAPVVSPEIPQATPQATSAPIVPPVVAPESTESQADKQNG